MHDGILIKNTYSCNCGHFFFIGKKDGVKPIKTECNINNHPVFLTYLKCPECNTKHYVQIDDSESLNILEAITKLLARIMGFRHRKKKIPKEIESEFKKMQEKLTNKRMSLKREFYGKKFIDNETGLKVELRFSFIYE